MSLAFKANKRYPVQYECPKTNLVFNSYCIGITQEEARKRIIDQGYTNIIFGDLEDNHK